jgi:RnfABCDGE-type electron transport complex D subunit
MLVVIIALLPATGFGIYNFGVEALYLILVTVLTCVVTEFVTGLFLKRPVTVGDYSAVVTGLLLALTLPPAAPLWIGIVGGIFAIVVVKMLFGGLGQNFMNPALAARCFLVIAYAPIMSNYQTDVYTGATPLAVLTQESEEGVEIIDMIIGHTSGAIGETSMIAILLGAVLLLLLGVIDLRIPATYIVSFIIGIALLTQNFDPTFLTTHLAGGGLMLGAFFMATDYVTRPLTKPAQIVYGLFLGLLTALFRIFGTGTEGVAFAIIIGNLVVPLLEKAFRGGRPAPKKGVRHEE